MLSVRQNNIGPTVSQQLPARVTYHDVRRAEYTEAKESSPMDRTPSISSSSRLLPFSLQRTFLYNPPFTGYFIPSDVGTEETSDKLRE
jgi:hypothetical protein